MPKRTNDSKSFFLLKEISEPDFGFTTGTCATAASLAATRMLLTQELVSYVILSTPKGIKVCMEISDQKFSGQEASCSVKKFSGSDPDVTNGIKIFSTVKKIPSQSEDGAGSKIVTNSQRKIKIDGGKGVGRVTLPGLDQKPGEAAINRVPRKMIYDGVKSELERFLASDIPAISVIISVPDGEEIAKKTFNPKLGIVGGISILGTSGIVEPMSEQAILDTIQVEMNVRKAQGYGILPLVPGNYGSEFMQREFGFSLETAVHCSNFVYDALQMAAKSGFKKILFCGHIGKLIKVAGGIKNTHSKYGDHRMEILCDIAKDFLSDESFSSIKNELMASVSTEEAIRSLDSLDSDSAGKSGLEKSCHETRDKIMKEVARRIQKNMTDWAGGAIEIEVVIFTNEQGLLAETGGARSSAMNFFKLLIN